MPELSRETLPFKIVIPSHGREDVIHKNPMLPWAHLVVRDEETAARYQAAIEKAGCGHPLAYVVSGYQGVLANIRQWVQDNVWDTGAEPCVWHMDDDFYGMVPLMRMTREVVTAPYDLAALFWETYLTAAEMGAHLFGYSFHVNVMLRAVDRPVKLRGCIQQCYGVSDPELRFDGDLYEMEDIDLSLQAMLRDRIVYLDYRWLHHLGPMDAGGGNTGIVTVDGLRGSLAKMQARWGDHIVSMPANKDAPGDEHSRIRSISV